MRRRIAISALPELSMRLENATPANGSLAHTAEQLLTVVYELVDASGRTQDDFEEVANRLIELATKGPERLRAPKTPINVPILEEGSDSPW